jgi:hypothetical protein
MNELKLITALAALIAGQVGTPEDGHHLFRFGWRVLEAAGIDTGKRNEEANAFILAAAVRMVSPGYYCVAPYQGPGAEHADNVGEP